MYHTPRTIMDKLNEFFKYKATQKGEQPMKYLNKYTTRISAGFLNNECIKPQEAYCN
jgi:hypothetical protein